MKNITVKKAVIFAYHLIILAMSWYFNLTFFQAMAWSLGLGEILVFSSPEIFMVTILPVVQTLIFLAAVVDGFTNLNMWWAKNVGWKINKSGQFMHWIKKQKSKSVRQKLFATWQMKLMSFYLMVNTLILSVILALIFNASEFTALYYVSLSLVTLCGIGYIWYMITFWKWMNKPMKGKEVKLD